jgi:hypothetical protein
MDWDLPRTKKINLVYLSGIIIDTYRCREYNNTVKEMVKFQDVILFMLHF